MLSPPLPFPTARSIPVSLLMPFFGFTPIFLSSPLLSPLPPFSEFLDGGSLEDFYEAKYKEKMRPFLPPVGMVHRWALELAVAGWFRTERDRGNARKC